MKVLFITSHITHPSSPMFLRNQTGFGYMVFDIAKHVAQNNHVDLFVANTFTPNLQIEGVNILKRSWLSYFSGLSVECIYNAVKYVLRYKLPLKRTLRELYMYTSIWQLGKNIKDYDVVHIHGCSEITDSAILLCKKENIPFVVTLHGLNSFEDSIKLHKSLKMYERDFLKTAGSNGYPVSFISTGNLKTVEDFIGHNVNSFRVICNGCDVERQDSSLNIRKEYNIPDDDFVFVFVGNVSHNKNQLQVARAWAIMPEHIRNKCRVLFVGRYTNEDDLTLYIQDNKYNDHLILCGLQPKEKVKDFYQASDASILTSITEGFGLSIIEGFVYGKPNITFADLPAVQDLYDPKAMALVHDRKDSTLSKVMTEVTQMSFDNEYIRNHASKFSYEVMTKKYLELYNSVQ